EAAAKLATDAVKRRDFPMALEALLPFATAAKKDYKAALLVGKAYLGMLQRTAALPYLEAAAKLKRTAAEPHFALGEAELAEGRWKKALKQLEQADDLGYDDAETLQYYLGIARYHTREYVAARDAFTRALWIGKEPAITASTEAYANRVRFDGWLDLHMGAG